MILAIWYQDPGTLGLIGAVTTAVSTLLGFWLTRGRDKATKETDVETVQVAWSEQVLKDNEIWRDRFEALENAFKQLTAQCQKVADEKELLEKRVFELEKNGGASAG